MRGFETGRQVGGHTSNARRRRPGQYGVEGCSHLPSFDNHGTHEMRPARGAKPGDASRSERANRRPQARPPGIAFGHGRSPAMAETLDSALRIVIFDTTTVTTG